MYIIIIILIRVSGHKVLHRTVERYTSPSFYSIIYKLISRWPTSHGCIILVSHISCQLLELAVLLGREIHYRRNSQLQTTHVSGSGGRLLNEAPFVRQTTYFPRFVHLSPVTTSQPVPGLITSSVDFRLLTFTSQREMKGKAANIR